jgi:hypothetical protein
VTITRITTVNERLWELGDTFEIFLRPIDQESYVEFHISPNNLRLQLRFDHRAAEAKQQGVFGGGDLMSAEVFSSRTWVMPEIGRWYVLADIPGKFVAERFRPMRGSEWLFSFSRYDYTRGLGNPVISSTSFHLVPDFHRQQEWGRMRFV